MLPASIAPYKCYNLFIVITFNVKSGTCELFIYGGCGGNGNNYMTKTDCEENCIITSPDGASNST
jgi:hypothetical protein